MSQRLAIAWTLLALVLPAIWGNGCDEQGAMVLLKSPVASKPGEDSKLLGTICSDVRDHETILRATLEAINTERTSHELRPLRLDSTLCEVAEFYACRMIEGGFFGHEDPYDSSTVDVRAVNFGYAYRKIGENLAAGQIGVGEVMAHWLRSTAHRANMLDPAYLDLGIGIKEGGEYGVYWVLEFGRPLTAPPDNPSLDQEEFSIGEQTDNHPTTNSALSSPEKTAPAAGSQPASQSSAH